MPRRDLVVAVLVALIWGLNFVVVKWGLHDVPPLLFAALRFAAVAVLAPLLPRPKAPWRLLLGYGVAWGTVQFGGLFLALGFGLSAGMASVVAQSQVVFTLLFALGLRLEAPRARHLWTIGLAFAGLVVIGTGHDDHVPLAGFAAATFAAAGWAGANVLARKLTERNVRVDDASFLAWVSVVPAVTLLTMSLALEGRAGIAMLAARFTTRTAIVLVYQSVLALAVGGWMWNALLRRHAASTVAPFSLLVPVIGLAAGHVAFGESIASRQWLGSGLLLAGLVANFSLARWAEEKKARLA